MEIKRNQDPRTQFEQERTQLLAKKNEADLAYVSMMLDVYIPETEEDSDGQASENQEMV